MENLHEVPIKNVLFVGDPSQNGQATEHPSTS